MRTPARDLLHAAATMLAMVFVAGCGGGGGGGSGGGGGGPAPALNISAAAPADGVVGVAYSQTIVVTGGTGARNFTINAGALPAGLALNATTGAISGNPTGPAATAGFTVTVTDSATPQQTDSQALTLDIVNPLAFITAALPGTSVGAVYNQSITASGGTAPYTFGVSSGSLPAGIVLASNGTLSGPATAAATTQTFTVVVTDSSSPALTASLNLTIAITLEIVTASLPDAIAGEFYSETLVAQGGLLPRSWSRIAGAMPAGISDPDSATGEISGTPPSACNQSPSTSVFTARVTDSAVPPAVDTQAGLSITVVPVDLMITTTALPNGVVGTPYSAIVQAIGGARPYTFELVNSALPDGLTLNSSTGAISGTPTTVTFSGIRVRVTDSCPASVEQIFSMTINAASLGRNDSIANATPLGNGHHRASISPSGHPNTVFAPDQDYYAITTTTATTVTVNMLAQAMGSPIDTVIEIVDANGNQLSTCVAPAFSSACEHDDEVLGQQLDSFLEIRVSGPTTFYVRVVDFRGDARPDMIYFIDISGVN